MLIISLKNRLLESRLVQHGEWSNWLQNNFQLTDRSAQRFMACAERFSKTTSMSDLNSTQMIQLLSLPSEEETERFIAQKAAEGKAIAELTIKELREEKNRVP